MIEPFSFPKNLQDGGRAQVTCAVSSGDMPVAFSWKKDGHQISPSLQVINTTVIILNTQCFGNVRTNTFFCLSIIRLLQKVMNSSQCLCLRIFPQGIAVNIPAMLRILLQLLIIQVNYS